MKNLANCSIREFTRQTVKMCRSVRKWLKATDIMNIRRRVPTLPDIPEITDRSDPEQLEKQAQAIKERREIVQQAALDNGIDMILAMLEENEDETLEVLAYALFLEPSEIDNYKMKDDLRSITEMICDNDVIDFFASLVQLDQKIGYEDKSE